MKKRVLLLTLTLCLLFAGCGKTPKSSEKLESNEPIPGFDAQNKYLQFPLPGFQETDGFFLGLCFDDEYLHYYDKASGISGFLCADPACAHDTRDCGAYIGSNTTVSYYNGKLYWVGADPKNYTNDYLWRSDLAGTNREKLKPVSREEISMVYAPQQYAVHRGKLFFLGKISSVSGTQVSDRISVLSTPLDDSEEFTTLYDVTFDYGTNYAFRFAGNYVYVSVLGVLSDGLFRMTVTKIDINSGKSEVVYDETDMTKSPNASVWVTQEGEIFFSGFDKNRLYLWKIENGNRVEVASWEEENPSSLTIIDGIAFRTYLKDGVRWVNIVNFSGETIYSGEIFPEKVEGLSVDPSAVGSYFFIFTGGDSEKLIWNLSGFGVDEDATIFIDLTDNMKATVLWTSEN